MTYINPAKRNVRILLTSRLKGSQEQRSQFPQRGPRLFVTIVGLLLVMPRVAEAGSAPLLVVTNFSVYLPGLLWILPTEYIVFTRMLRVSGKDMVKDVLVTNLTSTLIVQIALAVFVSVVAAGAGFLPGEVGLVLQSLGSWVVDGGNHNRLAVMMIPVWFVVFFVVTVVGESWLLRRRWARRGLSPRHPPLLVSLWGNSISSLGILLFGFLIWMEIFLP